MSDRKDINFPDPLEVSQTMARIAERSQAIVAEFVKRQSDGAAPRNFDPMNIGAAFMEMTSRMMTNPGKVVEAQMNLWQNYMTLWQTTAQRMLGQDAEPVVEPTRDDKRFKDEAWQENQVFDFIKQSYLLTSRWLLNTVRDVEGMDDKTAQKVDFYTRQFVDALAPSNFVMTNPAVLRATLESGGENLLKGLENLLADLENGKGRLSIRMTDQEAFELGKNIAITPGEVIYQNELMQLIQYTPTTDQVRKRPLLIVPPWINKYYILDLREKNSFVRYAVSQGFTVFVISWVNPGPELADKTFDDYMLYGPISAIGAIEQAIGEKQINALGYCLGGTLLSSTIAYLKQREQNRIASATLLTTMTDFSDAGELSVFIDEVQLSALEEQMKETGYLHGSDMATTFNMLRANDLIWSFVVNNYLLGKDPFPFDLLYWNSDSTRMPANMHSFYLRNMYQENLLIEPGGISLDGVPIDLSKVDVPVYMLSTKEDHIAPWTSTYAGTQHFLGQVTFVLAASGHIAGVVNPPEAGKYNFWVNKNRPKDPNLWFEGAEEKPGSWWPHWTAWLKRRSGGQVPARMPGTGELQAIEPAPGSFVKVRAQ